MRQSESDGNLTYLLNKICICAKHEALRPGHDNTDAAAAGSVEGFL